MIATCIDCHDLKDRFPIFSWPIAAFLSAWRGSTEGVPLELFASIAQALPEPYRSRVAWPDELPFAVRPFETWTEDALVTAVKNAPNTEARLMLAKCVALAFDGRNDQDLVDPEARR